MPGCMVTCHAQSCDRVKWQGREGEVIARGGGCECEEVREESVTV